MHTTKHIILTQCLIFLFHPPHLFVSDPEWGSCSLGVFICLICSGIHRNIPTIGKVKSVLLSHWEDSEVQVTEKHLRVFILSSSYHSAVEFSIRIGQKVLTNFP